MTTQNTTTNQIQQVIDILGHALTTPKSEWAALFLALAAIRIRQARSAEMKMRAWEAR